MASQTGVFIHKAHRGYYSVVPFFRCAVSDMRRGEGGGANQKKKFAGVTAFDFLQPWSSLNRHGGCFFFFFFVFPFL